MNDPIEYDFVIGSRYNILSEITITYQTSGRAIVTLT